MTHQVLGRQVFAPDTYAPEVLVAVPRALGRAALALCADDASVTQGHDVWNAYELAWRNRNNRPQIAMATLTVPADSPNLVESKSLKLYLGSLHATAFATDRALTECIAKDVGAIVGSPIQVTLNHPNDWVADAAPLAGESVDALDVVLARDVAQENPDPSLLRPEPRRQDAPDSTGQILTSQLLRTLCPVTGQPDWADLQIVLYGARLHPESFLRYVASFSRHTGFHEQCVEQILIDVQRATAARAVTVLARYTRRGGIDINPWRTTDPGLPPPPNRRTPRQ